MRDRKEQRRLHKMGCKEEKLDLKDQCGVKDPTPYEAVKRIISQERKAARHAKQDRMQEAHSDGNAEKAGYGLS